MRDGSIIGKTKKKKIKAPIQNYGSNGVWKQTLVTTDVAAASPKTGKKQMDTEVNWVADR